MLTGWAVVLVSFAYLCLLFAIAYYGDKRADQGRSLIANPYIYALSIAVYCTSWTFYGSVGRAASGGMGFLPVYLGPTLTFVLCWFVLRKIVRISKVNRITSIADFISSRYGKSTMLGGVVTVIAVVGILPYISLQLKAVATSFDVLLKYPEIIMPEGLGGVPLFADNTLYVALTLAAFSILFGTRHIDAAEHHEGMVAAIAFESIVKLIAFLAVGAFVTFGLHDGFGALFEWATAEGLAGLFVMNAAGGYGQWVTVMLLSMAAVMCLPRQFQVTVVENVNESHLDKATWLFPLYLLAINVFVLPIALSGLIHFPAGTVDADTFVLAIPMAERQEALTLLVYIGGLSAATGMVIVATIALSTMVCNDLIMPVLLRMTWLRLTERGELTGLLLAIRRGSIVVILMLAYMYFRFIGESYALVTIGLVSFAAAAQFAPAIVGGIFWRGASRTGALIGLGLGFATWLYTLLLPSLARSGWVPLSFLDEGPYGITLLRPYQLLGLTGMDHLSHALFWSMTLNIGGLILGSILSRPSAIERVQAALFVDVMREAGEQGDSRFWRGTATVRDLVDLAARFVGRDRAEWAFAGYARRRGLDLAHMRDADAELVSFAERLLAGAIGSASARVMVASVAKGEIVGLEEVMQILDETSQVIEHSHQLEQKSHELEAATAELRAANARLQELDRLKDDFISTISHELRTPLTSIRSFGEILMDNPEVDAAQRRQFLTVIVKESERLTRLINQILDFAKLESGNLELEMAGIDPAEALADAIESTSSLFRDRDVRLEARAPATLPRVYVDRDRLIQVIVNLLSNAVKFSPPHSGRVVVEAAAGPQELVVRVSDDGPGIPPEDQEKIFRKFLQAGSALIGKPQGTGLGLPICRQIVERFGGRIWVESRLGSGATFSFTLPLESALQVHAAQAHAAK
jgi:Na+/proline symporter/nitrogen-specific signal transduction histidine kinase